MQTNHDLSPSPGARLPTSVMAGCDPLSPSLKAALCLSEEGVSKLSFVPICHPEAANVILRLKAEGSPIGYREPLVNLRFFGLPPQNDTVGGLWTLST